MHCSESSITRHADRYHALHERIAPWQTVWGFSVIESPTVWESMEKTIPEAWFTFGTSVKDETLFASMQADPAQVAPVDNREWIRELKALCTFEKVTQRQCPLPLKRHLTPKKTHEIEQLLEFFEGIFPPPSTPLSGRRLLDIGGGMGHLGRALCLNLPCEVLTLDRDPALVQKGRELSEKLLSPPGGACRHEVAWGIFPNVFSTPDSPSAASFDWSVGLHTCAALAWRHLEWSSPPSGLLNLSCCYEKLNLAHDIERSVLARRTPLGWTEQALFLANRAGTERSLEEFLFQQRVLRYRFALDLWLRAEGRGLEAQSVGNTPKAEYEGSFADYVLQRLPTLGLKWNPSKASLLAFFQEQEELIERQRFAAFLQNRMARPLEVLLILDRALWLIDQHPECPSAPQILEFFDPLLSPRNLGIVWHFPSASVR